MILLLTAQVSTRGNPTLIIIIPLLLGVFLFYQGFRSFREYRILADTPIMPIRSIAMGLTHTRGNPTGDNPLTAPLTGASCFYYWVKVEVYAQRGKHNGWNPLLNEMDRRPFYLADGASRVLVDPLMAEFDVLPTFTHETGPKADSNHYVEPSLGVTGPPEQDLSNYLMDRYSRVHAEKGSTNASTVGAVATSPGAGYKLAFPGISIGGGTAIDFSSHRYRFSEECLLADRDCIVLGKCLENPHPQGDDDRNLITRGGNETSFLISSMSEQKTERDLKKKAVILILVGSLIIILAAAIAISNANLL